MDTNVPQDRSYTLEAVIGLFLLVGAGLFLVNIASAFAADDVCNDSYGGYTCADLTDAELTVEPSTDLVDRQTVQVTGVNFDPHGAIFGAAQCSAVAVIQERIAACDIRRPAIVTVDGAGSVSFPMPVRRIITLGDGTEIDCAVENACVIGAGTLDSNYTDAIEGAGVVISFDPDVPPAPDLEMAFTVDSATVDTATGTVTCNVDATYNIDMSIWQDAAGVTRSAYGYSNESGTCGVEPTTWTVRLMSGGARGLINGDATFNAYAYAYDGFSSAYGSESGETTLTGGPRPPVMVESVDGDFTSVTFLGVTGKGADQVIELEVQCNRPAESGTATVGLVQWAGLTEVSVHGTVDLDGCWGVSRVQVPLEGGSEAALAGGPARVVASAQVQNFGSPDTYFFDYASSTGTVQLTGKIPVKSFVPAPDANSRISITRVSESAITGAIDCDGPSMVSMSGGGTQRDEGVTRSTFGIVDLECDGVTLFSIPLENTFWLGSVDVGVLANAYRVSDQMEYEFLWSDDQSAATNVRSR